MIIAASIIKKKLRKLEDLAMGESTWTWVSGVIKWAFKDITSRPEVKGK